MNTPNTTTIDLSQKATECLQTVNNIGNTIYKDICHSTSRTLQWGSLDWLRFAGIIAGIGLIIFIIIVILLRTRE